ncbi:MAG: phasin family protein [Burkholderiales bacterium]|nr:phasin family protein [Burkholderiales bacterium]
MNVITEPYAAFSKQNFEAAMRFINVALEGSQRMLELQLNTAKRAVSDNTKNARALAEAADVEELTEAQASIVRPAFEKALEYSRNAYHIASETQNELNELFGQQISEFNRGLISLLDEAVTANPAGSDFASAAMRTAIAAADTAYDTMAKGVRQANVTTRQTTDIIEANVTGGSKKKSA